MFKNYIFTAFRNFRRNWFYSFLNILSLAIGITCVILISLYVADELSYDKVHKNHDRIHRLESHFLVKEQEDYFALTPFPLASMLAEEIPEIESYCRFMNISRGSDILYEYNGKKFQENETFYADSTLFTMFTHEFVKGTPEHALSRPFTVVITEELADRLFGDEDPIGKSVKMENRDDYEVTGVIKNLPENMHLQFKCALSMETLLSDQNFALRNNHPNALWNVQVYSYIMLRKGTDIKAVHEKFQVFYKEVMEATGKALNISFELLTSPLTDIHFHSKVDWDLETGNFSYIIIFIAIAFFLIFIACINYMNMATARSVKRAKEIGMRKVVGAVKGQIAAQFMVEAFLTALSALIISLVFVELLLPEFNFLTAKSFEFSEILTPYFLGLMFAIVVLTGLVSGSYPAFYLSAFDPISVLKSGNMKGKGGFLRKLLVVVQFTISTSMIIATLIVALQLNYLRTKDLGFQKENIVVTSVRDTLIINRIEYVLEELRKHPDIEDVATAYMLPGTGGAGKLVMKLETDDGFTERPLNFYYIDYHCMDLLGIELLYGRQFDENIQSDDSTAFIINETAAKTFGWGDNALEKRIQFGIGGPRPMRDGRVIGVVKDFNYQSLHNKVEPILLIPVDMGNRIAIKLKGRNVNETINFMNSIWESISPRPMDYFFMDQKLDKYYRTEKNLSIMFTYLSALSILISCLGLLGLSSYIIAQRTKEIGIRKVFGATNGNIIVTLVKNFIQLVSIGCVLAVVISYFLMYKWLESFIYSVKIPFYVFILGILISMAIAVITILFHAVKASNTNPADSLLYE